MSRLAKELEKRVLSVRDVWKCKTLEHQLRRQKRKTQVTASISLVQDDDDDDVSTPKTLQVYFDLLQSLLYAYAIAGVQRQATAPAQELRTTDSASVVQAPLDILLRYFWRAVKQVQQLPPAKQLTWLISKDQAERSRWVDVYRNSSLELGQVVSQVFSQREAMWEISEDALSPVRPKTTAAEEQRKQGEQQPRKGQGKGSGSSGATAQLQLSMTFKDGTNVCQGWNSSKGCLNKSCPDKHLCAVLLPSGRVCGGRHPAHKHAKGK